VACQQKTFRKKGVIYLQASSGQNSPDLFTLNLTGQFSKQRDERAAFKRSCRNLKIIIDVGPDKIGILDMSERAV